MHFVGLGHSHIVALAKGAYALVAGGADFGGEPATCRFHFLYDPPFVPPIDPETGALNAALIDAVLEGEPSFVLTSLGGNEHNVLSVSQTEPRFDFILGENPDLPLDPAAEILPESVIRETLWSWMREKTDVLKGLRSATTAPIYQIEPPPPLPRERVLAYPMESIHAVVDRTSMSSDVLRYKMWRAQAAVFQEVCAGSGVEYVAVPTSLIGRDGMLAEAFCGDDASHANMAFGEAMAREVLRRYMSRRAGTT